MSSADPLQNIKSSFESHVGVSTYEQRTLECSRHIAKYFLSLVPPLQPGARVLDNACGTGVVTNEILELYPGSHVDAVDASAEMIKTIRSMVEDKCWSDQVHTALMDGQDLKFEDAVFDASFTNFAIFFFPDPVKGAKEIYRTLKAGGKAIITAWHYVGWAPVMQEIQKQVAPNDPPFSIPMLERWSREETMKETLLMGGFQDVSMTLREVLYCDNTLDDLVRSLTGLMEPMMRGIWNLTDQGGMQGALLQVLETQGDKFLVKVNGKVGLKLIAWIAVATK